MRGIETKEERAASLNRSPFVGDLQILNDAFLWAKQPVGSKFVEDRRWVLLTILGMLQRDSKQELDSVMEDTHKI